MKGRPPTPTPILKARGSWIAPLREKQGEPIPDAGAYGAPDYLTDGARQVWARNMSELARIGVAASIDADLFALYCEAMAEWVSLVGKRGAKAVNARRVASERVQKLAQEFGLSPASRTRIRLKPKTETTVGKAKFFGAKATG